LYNYFDIEISNNKFRGNSAESGGAIYLNNLFLTELESKVMFRNNEYLWNSASNEGGVFFIDHETLNFYIGDDKVIE